MSLIQDRTKIERCILHEGMEKLTLRLYDGKKIVFYGKKLVNKIYLEINGKIDETNWY